MPRREFIPTPELPLDSNFFCQMINLGYTRLVWGQKMKNAKVPFIASLMFHHKWRRTVAMYTVLRTADGQEYLDCNIRTRKELRQFLAQTGGEITDSVLDLEPFKLLTRNM